MMMMVVVIIIIIIIIAYLTRHCLYCVQVFKKVLQSGEGLVRQEGHCPCPLMYEWHDKKYLGAAHGLAGIMYVLMQVRHHQTVHLSVLIIY